MNRPLSSSASSSSFTSGTYSSGVPLQSPSSASDLTKNVAFPYNPDLNLNNHNNTPRAFVANTAHTTPLKHPYSNHNSVAAGYVGGISTNTFPLGDGSSSTKTPPNNTISSGSGSGGSLPNPGVNPRVSVTSGGVRQGVLSSLSKMSLGSVLVSPSCSDKGSPLAEVDVSGIQLMLKKVKCVGVDGLCGV